MNNKVRVESDENIVTNAAISVRDPDGVWRDVRRAVRAATIHLTVGEVSRVELDLLLADVAVEACALEVSEEQQEAAAAILETLGWSVSPPQEKAA